MKVIITGGTGFLGVHLARHFLKQHAQVTLYDLAELDASDLKGKVKAIIGDVRNKKQTEQAVNNHDFLIHAAAALPIQRTKDAIFSTNIEGTKNVLSAALKHNIKRLVFISSTAVYGVPKHLPETEESPLDPIGYYGESKIAGEKLCQEYMTKGLQINIIRPKTFLGIERVGVFELWFEAIYNNHRLFILGNGRNPYQLLAVSDMVTAVSNALNSKVAQEVFNIGAKKFGSWREDLGAVIKREKSHSKITSLPVIPAQQILHALEFLNLSPIAAWHYKTMPVPSYVSTQKAEKLLGWKATKSNQEILLESYQWYKKHRHELRNRVGNTHRVGWNFKILNLISKF